MNGPGPPLITSVSGAIYAAIWMSTKGKKASFLRRLQEVVCIRGQCRSNRKPTTCRAVYAIWYSILGPAVGPVGHCALPSLADFGTLWELPWVRLPGHR